MDKLIKKRASIKSTITRIETFLAKQKDVETSVHEYSTREISLIKIFEKYSEIQDDIEQLDQTQEKDRIDIEEQYYRLHAEIKKGLMY